MNDPSPGHRVIQNGFEGIARERAAKDKTKQNRNKLGKNGAKDKLIVWYNGASRQWDKSKKWRAQCGSYVCRFSHDNNDIAKADGVIVHTFYLKPEERPPRRPNPNQIWIFFCREPESNLRYVKWPSKYWNTLFNWTMTYRSDSDIPYAYGDIVTRNLPNTNWLQIAKSKHKSAIWLVSHCETAGRREEYVKQLQKHGVQIDIYGKCGKLKCPKKSEGDCMKDYRFIISFESIFCGDYVTEKLFKAFKHDLLPVVRGGGQYSRLFPLDSMIDAAIFKTPKELAKYLLHLDANVTEYARVLKKKSRYRAIYPQPWCNICKRLHQLPLSGKTYPDMQKWLDMKKCYTPRDF